jgi:superfamily I DNA/RNA helicase
MPSGGPMTDEERRARSVGLARALDEIAVMTDETDTDEAWERFTRELDEDRLSDRKRFR